MEYIDNTIHPDIISIKNKLQQISDIELPKWVSFKKKERKSAPDSLWTSDEIRNPLRETFHNCCGYCGIATDVKEIQEGDEIKTIPTGQVDHYIPKMEWKALSEGLVYDWDNFVWACKDCNDNTTGKGSYYNEICMIFKPTDKQDTDYLIYVEEHGTYQVRKDFFDNELIQNRFKITIKKTMLNARSEKRKYNYKTVKDLLLSIAQYKKLSQKKSKFEKHFDNKISELNNFLKAHPDFKPLMLLLITNQLHENQITYS